jgi:hypothetical protein
MMSGGRGEAQSRGVMLKHVREVHADSVARAQALFGEQRQIQQAICQFARGTPRTVPEIAAEIGKPSHEVLWFVAALKKYGIVVEAGMCGDYPLYKVVDEAHA